MRFHRSITDDYVNIWDGCPCNCRAITLLRLSGWPSTQRIWVVTCDLSSNGVMPCHRFLKGGTGYGSKVPSGYGLLYVKLKEPDLLEIRSRWGALVSGTPCSKGITWHEIPADNYTKTVKKQNVCWSKHFSFCKALPVLLKYILRLSYKGEYDGRV
jgi:hypothetical protein